MSRIVPFKPEYAVTMLLQPSQALDWHDRTIMAERFAQAGNGFTLLADDGRALFCGGAIEVHPGHAQLWGLFAHNKGTAMPRLLRATRQFIAGLPHKRIDAPVADRPEAKRWAEWLGLRFDVRLADAAPGGGDLLIYRHAPSAAACLRRADLSALPADACLRAA